MIDNHSYERKKNFDVKAEKYERKILRRQTNLPRAP